MDPGEMEGLNLRRTTMSLYGLTKGTELEKDIEAAAKAEAEGVRLYYALARLAKDQGIKGIEGLFEAAAKQEARHAGFYSVLNGSYPENIWPLVRSLEKAETAGGDRVLALAAKVRNAGFAPAADEIEAFASEEDRHGEMLRSVLKKFGELEVKEAPKAQEYFCPVCGYVYEGDITKEDDTYVCPICGQPKSAFKPKK